MTEKTIETYLTNKVKQINGMAIKLYSPGLSGIPDRLVLLPGGKMFFAELKRPKGKPRPLQVAVQRQLTKLGFKVYNIDSQETVRRVMADEFYSA